MLSRMGFGFMYDVVFRETIEKLKSCKESYEPNVEIIVAIDRHSSQASVGNSGAICIYAHQFPTSVPTVLYPPWMSQLTLLKLL